MMFLPGYCRAAAVSKGTVVQQRGLQVLFVCRALIIIMYKYGCRDVGDQVDSSDGHEFCFNVESSSLVSLVLVSNEDNWL